MQAWRCHEASVPTLSAGCSESPCCCFCRALQTQGPALVVGALSTVGIDFDSWTETQGLTTTNGAVFFMDPEHGAETDGTNTVVVLQLTVPTGTSFTGSISAQGRAQGEMPDWEENSTDPRPASIYGERPQPAPAQVSVTVEPAGAR